MTMGFSPARARRSRTTRGKSTRRLNWRKAFAVGGATSGEYTVRPFSPFSGVLPVFPARSSLPSTLRKVALLGRGLAMPVVSTWAVG